MKITLNGTSFNPKQLIVPSVLFLFTAFLFSNVPPSFALNTNTQSTTSNVTINTYVAIALTSPLTGGVMFGSLEPNTADTETTTCNSLQCNVSVSADSNVAVDIVIKDNSELTKTAGVFIGNGNYTWQSTDGTSQPVVGSSYALSTTYDTTNKVGTNVAGGAKRTWSAWLDIPSAQTAGTYNNSISFCGEETGQANC
jgi:hypothetical protein